MFTDETVDSLGKRQPPPSHPLAGHVEQEINIKPDKRQIMNNKTVINSIIWPDDL
jgi:hypothetical protein